MVPFPRPFGGGLALAALVVAIDQASKWWIVDHVMNPPRVIDFGSVLNLVMVWNRGVSFGLFGSHSAVGPWVLSILALVIVGVLAAWLWRADRGMVAFALSLVIGGAVGNLIDRMRYGAVADFIDFHVGAWHWPAFNVADSAITVGAVLLIADSLFGGTESRKTEGGKRSGE